MEIFVIRTKIGSYQSVKNVRPQTASTVNRDNVYVSCALKGT